MGHKKGRQIDYLRESSDSGKHRVTYRNQLHENYLLSVITELGQANRTSSVIDTSGQRYPDGLEWEFLETLLGLGRPFDRAIPGLAYYRDIEYFKEHRLSLAHRCRMMVSVKITTHGNLSVTLSPNCLSDSGYWEPAPEWKMDPFRFASGFRERPGNEVLFFRGVEGLFGEPRRDLNKALLDAQRRAVLFAFWMTMERISNVFELHFEHYIVGLSESDRPWIDHSNPIVGLEIVDALFEYRMMLAEELRRFKAKTGYDPDVFFKACEARASHSFDKVSKRIRYGVPGSEGLTPKVVERYFDFLEEVKAFGIWTPE